MHATPVTRTTAAAHQPVCHPDVTVLSFNCMQNLRTPFVIHAKEQQGSIYWFGCSIETFTCDSDVTGGS